MSTPSKFQTATLTSAAVARFQIKQGSAYGLIVGTDASNFNSQSITPKQGDGKNTGTAAAGTLTVDTLPTAGDTMLIGSRTYTFIAADREPAGHLDEIQIGATVAATQAAIVAAINGSDTDPYAIKPNADVSAAAFAADDSVITAREGGIDGNAIATTETFTAGTNVFDAATLGTTTAGTDTFASAVALPTPGSADSSGSPQAFAAKGMIEFIAILPELLLTPSGAVTSVEVFLTELDVHRSKV